MNRKEHRDSRRDYDKYDERYEHVRDERPRRRKNHRFRNGFLTGVIVMAALLICFRLYRAGKLPFFSSSTSESSAASADSEHDVTLDKHTYADFATPILGEAKREALLTVEERPVSVIVNNTEEGFFNWEILQKSEALRYYGTAQYTVDLYNFSARNVVTDHDTKTVTITIPDVELHSVTVDPDRTEVLSRNNGLLAWGKIELTTEQQGELESSAVDAMKDELDKENAIEDARRFAHLSAWEVFWPVVQSVSQENNESYKLEILQDSGSASESENSSETDTVSEDTSSIPINSAA